jgi:hypothetical protein
MGCSPHTPEGEVHPLTLPRSRRLVRTLLKRAYKITASRQRRPAWMIKRRWRIAQRAGMVKAGTWCIVASSTVLSGRILFCRVTNQTLRVWLISSCAFGTSMVAANFRLRHRHELGRGQFPVAPSARAWSRRSWIRARCVRRGAEHYTRGACAPQKTTESFRLRIATVFLQSL